MYQAESNVDGITVMSCRKATLKRNLNFSVSIRVCKLNFQTGSLNNRHFQITANADVDTYVDTYADLKYKGCVCIYSND